MTIDRSNALARWISIVFHPFVMVGVMVGTAAAARQGAGGAVRAVALTALLMIVPMAILKWRQVRRGPMAERRLIDVGAGAAIHFV